jgi:hypothetical protein
MTTGVVADPREGEKPRTVGPAQRHPIGDGCEASTQRAPLRGTGPAAVSWSCAAPVRLAGIETATGHVPAVWSDNFKPLTTQAG